MSSITSIPPDILRYRHRLSVQQINALFGSEVIKETHEEKAGALMKVAEFIRITDLLRTAGIDFVPLKGPLLSYRLYGDATARRYGDIDILVEPAQVDMARKCLMAAGYTEYILRWPQTDAGRQKALTFWHDISFRNPAGEVITELHWKLSYSQWFNFRDSSRFVSDNLCTVEFSGNVYQVLTPEAELLFLVIHGGMHRWGMLRWLVDINRYSEFSGFDWEKFCGLVKCFGCGRMVTLCNMMLAEFFPDSSYVPLPGGTCMRGYLARKAMETIEKPRINSPKTIRELLSLLPYSLLAYPGLTYKMRVLGMIAGNSLFSGRLSRLFD